MNDSFQFLRIEREFSCSSTIWLEIFAIGAREFSLADSRFGWAEPFYWLHYDIFLLWYVLIVIYIINMVGISEKSNKKQIHNLLYCWPILSFTSILYYFWSEFSDRSCCGNIFTLRIILLALHQWFSLYQLLELISLHILNSYQVDLHFYLLSSVLVHWLSRITPNRLRHDQPIFRRYLSYI